MCVTEQARKFTKVQAKDGSRWPGGEALEGARAMGARRVGSMASKSGEAQAGSPHQWSGWNPTLQRPHNIGAIEGAVIVIRNSP